MHSYFILCKETTVFTISKWILDIINAPVALCLRLSALPGQLCERAE
jgi:hypothetical protein